MAFTSKGPLIFLSGPDFTPPPMTTVWVRARAATTTRAPARRIFMLYLLCNSIRALSFRQTIRQKSRTGLPPLDDSETTPFKYEEKRPSGARHGRPNQKSLLVRLHGAESYGYFKASSVAAAISAAFSAAPLVSLNAKFRWMLPPFLYTSTVTAASMLSLYAGGPSLLTAMVRAVV